VPGRPVGDVHVDAEVHVALPLGQRNPLYQRLARRLPGSLHGEVKDCRHPAKGRSPRAAVEIIG